MSILGKESMRDKAKIDTEPLLEFPEPYSKFPLTIDFTYGAP